MNQKKDDPTSLSLVRPSLLWPALGTLVTAMALMCFASLLVIACSGVAFAATWGPTSITATADDGYEAEGDSRWYASDQPWTYNFIGYDGGQLNIGARFTNITIPQGSTINSATIEVRHGENDISGTPTGQWQAWDADNAGQFTTGAGGTNRPSTVPLTTASVTHNPSSGAGWKSASIGSVIQEIVDRPGWVSGNAINLVWMSTNAFGSHWFDFNDVRQGSNTARLTIDYSPPGTYSNTNPITINDNNSGTPYPSTITVPSLSGIVTNVAVTITGLTHTYPDDVRVLLVGPQGENVMLMYNQGAGNAVDGVNLTFDDSTASELPDSQITSGTYKPCSDTPQDDMNSPAPAGPYGTTLSAFNGVDPQGDWSLYVLDYVGNDSGTISGGWELTITAENICWSSELLTNPGFETGDATGWSNGGGGSVDIGDQCSWCDDGPHSGSFQAYWENTAAGYYLYQEVDLSPYAAEIDAGVAVITATGWLISNEYHVSPDYDVFYMQVRFYDEGLTEIAGDRYDTGTVNNANWAQYGITNYTIPTGARSIQIRFYTWETDGAWYDAGSADDFSVKVGTPCTCSAISFDAASSATAGNANSITWQHTVGTGGSDRVLIVGVSWRNSGNMTTTVTGVTYNGDPLTEIRKDEQFGDPPGSRSSALYYLVNPDTGGAYDIVVTFTGSEDFYRCVGGAISLFGVDQSSPLDDDTGPPWGEGVAGGTGGTASVTVTTNTHGAWVIDTLALRQPSGTASVGSGQTPRWNEYGNGVDGCGSHEGPKTPAGDVTMSWSLPTNEGYSISAVALKPACSFSGDNTPDAFNFTDQTDVALSTQVESDIVQVTGMDNGTAISVDGVGSSEYRICTNSDCSTVAHTWASASGSIDSGEYVQLRLTSSASYSTATVATLTVGTANVDWSVTTVAGGGGGISFVGSDGGTETPFSFDIGTAGTDRLVVIIADVENTGVSADLTAVTVDSKACNHIVTADNPSGAGNHQEMWYCDEDDLGASNGPVTVAITSGVTGWGVHAHLYTGVDQGGPTDFGIDDTSAATDTAIVYGIDVPANGLVVMGAAEGQGGLTINSWTSPLTERTNNSPAPTSADLITASDIETSAQTNKTYTATFSGAHNRATGIVAVWGIGIDNTPDAFDFTDQTDVAVSSQVESDIVQVNGMDDGTAISVDGVGSSEYRICTNSDCSTVAHTWASASGSIDSGEYVQLRLTSSASYSTATVATLTVGTLDVDWSVTTEAAPGESFCYRKPIIIDHNQIGANCGSDLTNFPVMIKLTGADFQEVENDVDADGYDIIFKAEDDTTCGGVGLAPCTLDHEMEVYDEGNDLLVAWVRIPTLSISADTTIYVYYGDPAISSPTENPSGVWDTSYKGVWHLSESSGDAQDSTSYGTSGTVAGTVTQGSTGNIDYAYDFYTNGEVNCGDPADGHLDGGTGSLTVDLWVNTDANRGTWEQAIYKGGSSEYGYGYALELNASENTYYFIVNDGSVQWGYSKGTSFTLDTWHHIVGVVDRATDELRVYKDGVEQGTATDITGLGNIDSTSQLALCKDWGWIDGLLDEVHISGVARDACWIETEYSNQKPSSIFLSIDPEESMEPSAGISGAITSATTEADIVGGGKMIVITLANDTWVATGAEFDAQRQNIINGLNSAQSEATGWNNEVRDNQSVSGVVRTSDTVVSITLDAQSGYDISSDETITVTLPASALVTSSTPLVASPTFDVSYVLPSALTLSHYRWRNDDGTESGGLNTGTGADGSVTVSGSQNINTAILGSNRVGNPDGVVTTVSSFGSATGGTTLTVGSANGFAADDEVLLINLQGDSSNSGNVGNYEFLEIQSIASNTLTFKTPIQKIYGATASNSDLTGQKVIVQRVPQWTDVTVNTGGSLTANPWDGTSGGIIVFRATGTVSVAGTTSISADGLGYGGGTGGMSSGTPTGGANGESYDGTNGSAGSPGSSGTLGGGAGSANNGSTNTTGTRGGGGGGGAEPSGDTTNGGGGAAGGGYGGGGGGGGGSGDGGGASGTGGTGGNTDIPAGGGGGASCNLVGGDGGNAGSAGGDSTGDTPVGPGGAAGSGATTGTGGGASDYDTDSGGSGGGGGGLYGDAALTKIFFGSGGGGGGGADEAATNAPDGGAGGGIIFIIADTVTVDGSVSADGADGVQGGPDSDPYGASGGGAGGSIRILANSFTNNATFSADGGARGGVNTSEGGSYGAGGGGGGVGRIRIEADSITGTTSPTASTAGTPSSGSGATFAADEDTELTGLNKNTNTRVRFLVSNSGGTSSGVNYQLEFAETDTCGSGSYTPVPTSAGVGDKWEIVDSTYITDGEATSDIDDGVDDALPNPGAMSFVAGELRDDDSNSTSGITLDQDEFTEIEFTIQATDDALDATHYCFRLTDSGTDLDSYSNYAEVTLAGVTATTTLGDGTDPGNAAIAPSASATELDSFTLQTNTGSDTVTQATVTLAAGTHAGISLVEITSDDGLTVYGSASDPTSDTVSIGSMSIPVSTTLTQFKVRITPKTHANMPAPAGSTYSVTGTISSFTSTNGQAGTDTDSATATIDNLSPGNVTGAGATPGDTQVTVSWTNPGDADFSNLVVLRNTATISDVPSEGSSPALDSTIGTSVVRYISSGNSFVDTGLINGQIYFYRIFAKDTNGNYSASGVEVSATPAESFTYRKPIIINQTEIGPSCGSDLPDFPVLVRIHNDSELKTAPAGHVESADGYDIVFRASDGLTGLDHEIEYYGDDQVTLRDGWYTGTGPYTVPAASDRLLVFVTGFETSDGSQPTITDVTFGGVSMSPASQRAIGTTPFHRIEIWTLKDANIPASGSFSVSYSSSVTRVTHAHALFTRVDQTDPIVDDDSGTTTTGDAVTTDNPFNVVSGGMSVSGAICNNVGNYDDTLWGSGWRETTDQDNFYATMGTASTENAYGADGTDSATATYVSGATQQVIVAASLRPTSGATLIAWVRIPTLSYTSDTTIYMYYGNSNITSPTENPEGVWDDNYKAVWHLNESGSGVAGEFKDSTQFVNHGQGGSGTGTQVPMKLDGMFSKAQDFDGTDDHINMGDPSALGITGNAITLEAWVKYPSAPQYGACDGYDCYYGILSKGGYSGGYRFMIGPDERLEFQLTSPNEVDSATTMSPVTWYHVVNTYDGTTMRAYINGVKDTNESGRTGPVDSIADEVWIGHGGDGVGDWWDYPFTGTIDEIRISDNERDQCWIETEYSNQKLSSTLISVDPEEELEPTAAVSGTITSATTESDIVSGGKTIVITLTNDTWDADIGSDNSQTQDLIDGLDSDSSEASGWDAVVKAGLDYTHVSRTSDTIVTVTLPAFAAYDITANETITVTVPASALVTSSTPLVASPSFDISPLVSTVTLYRSVGTDGDNLNSESHTVTISGSTATFSDSMPDNIGVGDVLEYQVDTTYYVAFIHGRTSDTVYTVKSASGGDPQAASSDTAVNVYRAYTSLANWQALSENSNIDTSVVDFDSSRDITGSYLYVACYADGNDSSTVTIQNWTVDSDKYIKIYTPTSTSEVGTSQRHNGTSSGGYSREVTTTGNALLIEEENVRVEGLRLRVSASSGGPNPIRVAPSGSGIDVRVSHCVISGVLSGSVDSSEGIIVSGSGSGTVRIWNNVVYGFNAYDVEGSTGIENYAANQTAYIYNNTVYDCITGIWASDGTVVAKNNIAFNNGDDYAGTFSSASDYNLGEDAAFSGDGNYVQTSQTATEMFVDPAGSPPNFHILSSSDAYDAGTDQVSEIGFSDDIDASTRPFGATWDIGADESTGLIAHWKFDEGAGSTAADSAGTNDGTLEGTNNGLPAWTCVIGGSALTFDGDDDEVDLPGPVIGDRAAWTVTAWIKMGVDTADKRTIYSEGDTLADEYWTLYVGDSENVVTFWSPNGSAYMSGTTNVEDGAWHLVTLVQRSKTDRELYVGTVSQAIDTTDMGTLTYDAAAIGTLKYIYGGVPPYDPADPFLGTIDDVRIYDRALSFTEISALASSPPVDCGANSPPSLTVDQPDGTGDTVTVGNPYSIQYDLADADDVVTVAFYYDTDGSGLDGTAITGDCAIGPEGTDMTCSWDTTGVTPGSYYVYGVTSDGINPDVTDYSPGQVTINANTAPTLNVDEPDGAGDTVTVGDPYSIQYDLADTDDEVTVAFYYDSDNSGLDGTAISGECASGAEGTDVTCSWDTTGMTAGSYYVYGVTSDGINPDVTDYSPGQITINGAPTTRTVAIYPSGATPPAGYDATYTSMSAMEAAENADLVALNRFLRVEIVNSDGNWSTPDTAVTFDGWNCDRSAGQYVEIEVMSGARNPYTDGKWSSSHYRLSSLSNTLIIDNDAAAGNYFEADFIGVQVENTGGDLLAAQIRDGAYHKTIKFEACHFRGTTGFEVLQLMDDGTAEVWFINSIIENSNISNDDEIVRATSAWITAGTAAAYFYNCTVVGGGLEGLDVAGGTITVKNCAVFNNDSANDISQSGATIDYVASDASVGTNWVDISPGASEPDDWNAAVIDYANGDYRVKDTNSVLYHTGLDQNSDSNVPAEDIAGNARPAGSNPVSIGAFEVGAPSFETFQYVKAIEIDRTKIANPAGTFPIAFDALSSDQTADTGASSLSWSHTVGSGSDRIVIVSISTRTGQTISSVTFGGTDITSNLIGSAVYSGYCAVYMYYMKNPSAGPNTVEVIQSGTVRFVGAATSFFNVDQTTPFGAFAPNTGSSNPWPSPSVTVTNASGQVVVAVLAKTHSYGATKGVADHQVERWNRATADATPANNIMGAGALATGSGPNVDISWEMDDSTTQYWAIGGVAIMPTTVAPPEITTLTNYPLLYSVTDPDLQAHVTSADGWDIIFRALDDTTCGGAGLAPCTLDHEMERYESGTGRLVAWVRIPSVNGAAAGSNTVIYIYYGNSDITSPTENKNAVWDSNFMEVWHLGETSGGPADSTSNNYSGTIETPGNVTQDAAGNNTPAYHFAGAQATPSYLTLSDGTMTANAPYAIEGWFYIDTTVPTWWVGFVTKDRDTAEPEATANWAGLWTESSELISFGGIYNKGANLDGSTLSAGQWYYGVAAFDGGLRTLYLNGQRDPSALVSSPTVYLTDMTLPLRVNQDMDGGGSMTGVFDEVRVSTAVRSPGWILTTYNNIDNPGDIGSPGFYTIGSEQGSSNSPPTLTVSQPDGSGDTVTVGDTYDIYYDLSDDDDVVTVAFYYDDDDVGENGIAIAGDCSSAPEGTGVYCTWDTTGMTPGTYYVYGITDDGTNPQVTDYSPGQITIEAAISEGSASFNYLSSPQDVSPGTAGEWVDVDVSAYIPSGATGVILQWSNPTGSDYYYGVRNNGSMDDPALDQVAKSSHQGWFMIGVDANRIFEVYVENTGIKTYLMGYTMDGVTFFTNWVDKTPTTDGTWQDIDISSETGGDTAIGAIFYVLSQSGSGLSYG